MNGLRTNPRIGVVMITRNRRVETCATVERLLALPERPRIVVVDNGSSDGTVPALRARHGRVEVIEAGANLGSAGRNIGVVRLRTPYVAFADDDSWWEPGALDLAADRLDADPHLALIAARILVGPGERLDPICEQMEALKDHAAPDAIPIVGFAACGAVVRRSAFLGAGGFERRFGVGGEEAPLALDLLHEGWRLRYMPDIVAYHHPSPTRDPGARRRREVRNALWSAWLRRPLGTALARTGGAVAAALIDRDARAGVAEALHGAPWVARGRRPIPAEIERLVRRCERYRPRRAIYRTAMHRPAAEPPPPPGF